MVSGTTWPDGDPFLQRQNEPSLAASTRNPLHLLGGANDYRTIDLPGLPGDLETGDAWLGVFKSTDGGQRWTSTLLPGYPQDPHRSHSPLGVYGAAADAVVRAGTNGLVYFAGLAFNRGANGASGVFVSRFIDNNNREKGDTFAYLGTRMVATDPGTTGRLLDKPWIAVDIPRGVGGTCRIQTPGIEAGAPPIVQRLPAGAVYVAYSAFTGDGPTLRSDIFFTASLDCGVTWLTPRRVTNNDGTLNQGATIAIDPTTGTVYVAWRRFTRSGQSAQDAMMVARSVTLGRNFEGPKVARRMPRGKKLGLLIGRILEHRKSKEEVEVAELSQFDQRTLADELSFRTNAYPTIAFDDQSRLYMAWAERGFSTVQPDPSDGDAKIVMSTSRNGASWTPAVAVAEPSAPGHQIMPSLAFAGGKLLLVYYDLREDVTGLSTKFIDDKTAAQYTGKRHTMDIRASMGTPGDVPAFAASVPVSDYFVGRRPGGFTANSKIVPCAPGSTLPCEQLQFNPPNLPMFQVGTVPFIGDYIDVAPAPAFVPTGNGKWAYNTSANSVPVFHAVWTDNRDVRAPAPGTTWADYTPPDLQGSAIARPSLVDPTAIIACAANSNTGIRNQNIYTARITGGLLVGSPGNTKPLSKDLQRGFVVFAQNMTTATMTFRMRIVSQPEGGQASFEQLGDTPVTYLDVVTPPRSTASRTVYVTATDPHAQVNVDVSEISSVGAPTTVTDGLRGIVILNADIENPDIENADIENADIENADIENVEITNADIENPTVRSADIENADIENADIENADIENADIENADIENADIENADIENADIENSSLTDITWNVTNTGNTTAAFNVNMFLNDAALTGVKLQLVLYKTYTTPAATSCDLKLRSHTVLMANILHPVFIDPATGQVPDPNSPEGSNGTLWLAPGETGKITLRVLDTDLTNNVPYVNDKGETLLVDPGFVPGETLSPVVVPQEIATPALEAGATEPEVITPDQSTMFFVQQPTNTIVDQPMIVKVQVRGTTGEVLPGVAVHLSVAGASVTGGDAISGLDGVAVFTVQVSPVGTLYVMTATAPAVPALTPQSSASFDVLPVPVPSFVVVNTNDSGAGSLRQALLNANSWPGPDTVTFAIPGAAPYVIAPTSPLPVISSASVIDATGQPGYDGRPVVEIDGAAIGATGDGLNIGASDVAVRGLAITRFPESGLFVFQNLSGVLIENNLIGTDRTGAAKGNAKEGIQMRYISNSRIQGNVISGNGRSGVLLEGGASNVVANNTIGLDPDGLAALPNVLNGITMYLDATSPRIDGNLISGNNGWGIELQATGQQVSGALIVSNTIGLDRNGNVLRRGASDYISSSSVNFGPIQRGNLGGGIRVAQSLGTVIGATATPNVISGNSGNGVWLTGASATPAAVRGNYIGTGTAGDYERGNFDGVTVEVAGGSVEGNVISGNISDGVTVNAANVMVRANFVGTNVTGVKPIGNGRLEQPFGAPGCCHAGIAVMSGGDDAVIGGEAIGSGNLVSANHTGIWVNAAARVRIEGNVIGPKLNAPGYLPNDGDAGIALYGSTNAIVRSNTIAGNAGLAGVLVDQSASGAQITENTIVNNQNAGVTIGEGTGHSILSNSIGGNTAQGIDLAGDGPTANDTNDTDGGPNFRQNFPDVDVDGAVVNHGVHKTYMQMRIDSAPGDYRVQVFTAPATSCSGSAAQGEVLIGDVTVHGGFGAKVFELPEVADGTLLSATATAPDGSTSEFSPCVSVASTKAVYRSDNGHFYEYVPVGGTQWTDAKTTAQSRTLLGRSGHLVTIADAVENAFVQAVGGGFRAWIGLSDAATEGTFVWVTGQPLTYSNWSSSEPNNSGGAEDYVEMFGNGRGNDNQNFDPTFTTSGYLIEYEFPS
ncbi:MAG: hypothetical protein A3G21_20500 [Acidobacteria bacterium RIFCSPLOWO2_12_FULL_66_21]|nr:MAG: hypothetical protein A3G21_20500 [Acidobacteria bacterium RIFCSPLOWO2_12_FULL_66_21]